MVTTLPNTTGLEWVITTGAGILTERDSPGVIPPTSSTGEWLLGGVWWLLEGLLRVARGLLEGFLGGGGAIGVGTLTDSPGVTLPTYSTGI